MIIDAHYHLEERLETVEELVAQMEQHGVSRAALIAPGVGLVNFKGIRSAARKSKSSAPRCLHCKTYSESRSASTISSR